MQYLPKPELAKIFRTTYAMNRTHHLAMLIGFFTGARISQILRVCGEDIFQRDGKWVIMIRAAKRGEMVIHSLHVDEDPAFDMSPLIALAKTKGRSLVFGGLTRQYFNKCFKPYAEAAGIHTMFAHSHVLRHSAAMVIFDATQRIGAVSQFLAHKSPASAFVYLKENDSHLAQEAMDGIEFN